jgi:hypothetical protein
MYTDLTEGGDPQEYRPNKRNGSYIFNLKPCNEYLVEYTLNENVFYETEYKIPCDANFYENDIVKLVDDKGNIVIESIRDIRCKTTTTDLSVIPVEFQKFYGYNLKGIAKEEKRWNEFVQGTIDIINKRGSVKIDIEGSASYVPTKTFGSNTVLADKRAKDAKQMLLDELKAKGVDAEKVKFVAVNAKVQGPKYKGDYQNKEKYGQYQYIFIKAY